MAVNSLRDALVDELKDILSAEHQITKALPKMAKKAGNTKLQNAFNEHLDQTKRQIERLEQALKSLNASNETEECEAMAGLIEEGEELLKKDAEPSVKDALLIAAAQKVEHYEMASYGTVCAWADQLGLSDISKLLGETLAEEKSTDEKLNKLAATVNPAAAPS